MTSLRVLFVCIGNSCRSPMAEAIANALGGGRIEAQSAGLAPAGWVAETTLKTLERMGYSGVGLWSKGLESIKAEDVDVAISLLGSRGIDLLPPGFGTRREAWPIPDPIGEDEAFYTAVAQQIEQRIRGFLADEAEGELLLT
ncbi:MAG: low molecular weight phosphatase family protein [Thermoanaerobaculales bacterium]